jgi:hypothetical protein
VVQQSAFGLDDRRLGVRFQGKSREFCLLQNLHPMGVRGCFNRARVFGLVADHSSPYIATTKTVCCCISTTPYVSVGWVLCLIRHRVEFSFFLFSCWFYSFFFFFLFFFVALKNFFSLDFSVLFFVFPVFVPSCFYFIFYFFFRLLV